jgi:hypothetical protein
MRGVIAVPRARLIGVALLAIAAAMYIVMPPGLLTIALAAAAWVAFRADPGLGPIPGALVVVLALPYDRAADAGLLRVGGIPVRPHDVVIGLALVAALLTFRRFPWTTGVRLLALWLLVGLAALVLGVAAGQEARDVLRDARWWGLYAAGLVWAGQHRPLAPILRATLIGLAIFSLLAVAIALLPTFPNGTKERALIFDGGVLRMQFGPTTFLLVPIAYWASRVGAFRRWTAPSAWLGLALLGLGLSVTRVSIATALGVLILVGLAIVLGTRPWGFGVRRAFGVANIAVAGLGLAFIVNILGIRVHEAGVAAQPPPATAPASPSVAGALPAASGAAAASASAAPTPSPEATPSPTPVAVPLPQDPWVRFIPDVATFVLGMQARFASYANAIGVIGESPLIGRGLGQLVDVDYDFTVVDFATPGKLPNVDNAYLTIAMKAGLVGVVAFAALVLGPAWRLLTRVPRRARRFLLPAWIGLLVLTMSQSYAVIGHSPFVLGILIAAVDKLPQRPRTRPRTRRTTGTDG